MEEKVALGRNKAIESLMASRTRKIFKRKTDIDIIILNLSYSFINLSVWGNHFMLEWYLLT